MEKLRLRCPTCSKLYEVSGDDITSHSPQFDCIACSTRFTFNYPVPDAQNISTFVVSAAPVVETGVSVAPSFQEELEKRSFAALQQEIAEPAEAQASHACPKCGALNDKKSKECYSCHVLFERLVDLPLDPALKAQPSLVRKWKNLVLNFDNRTLHEDFLKSCHELDALRFAILKYEELQKAQGGKDELCEAMVYKAHSLLQVTLYDKRNPDVFARKSAKAVVPWHKYVVFTPLLVSLLMILTGFFSLSQRNLVGAGVAMMVLTFGLTLFWKGRISLSDFIN